MGKTCARDVKLGRRQTNVLLFRRPFLVALVGSVQVIRDGLLGSALRAKQGLVC